MLSVESSKLHVLLSETSNSGSEQALIEGNNIFNIPKINFHLSLEEIFINVMARFSLLLAFFHFLKRLLGSGEGSEVVLALRD